MHFYTMLLRYPSLTVQSMLLFPVWLSSTGAKLVVDCPEGCLVLLVLLLYHVPRYSSASGRVEEQSFSALPATASLE